MWHSGRCIANASVPWRRGRSSCTRHVAATGPFASSATLPWGQAASHWRLNVYQASHGFFRSYARKSDKPPATTQELEDLPDDTESATQNKTHKSGVAHQPGGDIRTSAPWHKFVERRLDKPREDPEVLFNLSAPTHETLFRSHSEGIHRLSGYSSDSESIKIYFEQDDTKPFRRPMKLSKLYLRDICQCSRCVCPSTGQKTFATCDIFPIPRVRDPETENIRLSADGGLEITWKDDFLTGETHTSVYPQEFLNRLAQRNGGAFAKAQPVVVMWDAASFRDDMKSRDITFHDWMEGGPEFAQAVLNLHEYGLVFMRGVPKSQHCVQTIAEKIGNLQSTIHGRTWDIVSSPEAESSARSNEYLRLHQDLLYWKDQPQVQFLHCLENDCHGGGEFLFTDGFHAASELRHEDRHSHSVLSTQLVTFLYQRDGHYLSQRRRVIQSGKHGEPQSISWSPAFQGPFRISEHLEPLSNTWQSQVQRLRQTQVKGLDGALHGWGEAAKMFQQKLGTPKNVLAHRLRPGECVIFDSKRVLHGRTGLEGSDGRMHLRGAYVDGQTLHSALVNLIEKGLLKQYSGGVVYGPLDLFASRGLLASFRSEPPVSK